LLLPGPSAASDKPCLLLLVQEVQQPDQDQTLLADLLLATLLLFPQARQA